MIYCPYLWKSQCILPNSRVLPCCHSSTNNYNDVDLTQGITTEKHKQARQLLSKGIWPDECSVCEQNENSNIKSPRQRANEFFEIDNKLKVSLEYLDIKFDNTCNLSCRMCNPQSSSQIEKLWKDAESVPNFLKDQHGIEINNTLQQSKKLEYTKECIKNGLKHLKVTGGEPFASREFLDLLAWCTDNNYEKNLGLSITTNGTKYNQSLLKKLVKFKYLSIVVSVDGTEKTYDYIRHGITWDKLIENCDLFDEFFKDKKEKFVKHNDTIHVSTVLQFFNMFDICNLIDWCYNRNYIFKLDVNLKPKGSELQVRYLPKEMKQLVIDQCDLYLEKYKNTKWACDQLNSLKKYLLNNIDNSKISKHQELKRTILLQDNRYKTDYRDYLTSTQIDFLDSI